MSEEILVRQGAPTLAGIKTGSLFPCPCEDKEALFADIRRLNRLLVPKGLCLLPIRFLKGQVLLYLYRPSELRRDLENEQAAEILHHAGYNSGHCGRCIANLIRRFREGGEFPHEVGLFLIQNQIDRPDGALIFFAAGSIGRSLIITILNAPSS